MQIVDRGALNVGRFQLLLWPTFRFGLEPVPRAFQSIYASFFWLGPLEIRKFTQHLSQHGTDFGD